MQKVSKVKTIEFKNEWTGDKGVVYYHNILFENGDTGSAGFKEKLPSKASVGSELAYELIESERGNKIKVLATGGNNNSYQKPGFQKPDPKMQMVTFAASYTKDLVVAGKAEMKDFTGYADKMYEWMKSKIEA